MADESRSPIPRALAKFEKTGELQIGVEYAGGRHTEFTVGPLTVDAELAAEADLPDWIDPDLIWKFGVSALTDEERRKYKFDTPAITAPEKRRAARMVEARYAIQTAHRVTRLGGIPPADIPAAVRSLIPSDMKFLVAAAEGVDDLVDRFREENQKRMAADGGAGDGGDSALVDVSNAL